MQTQHRNDLRRQLGVRMDVHIRDAQPGDRDLVAVIERSVREHAERTGRAPALVLALGAEAPADEVRMAMEAIA